MTGSQRPILWVVLCCALVFAVAWLSWWARTDTGISPKQESAIDIPHSEPRPAGISGNAGLSDDFRRVTSSHRSLTPHQTSSGNPAEGASLPDRWSKTQSETGLSVTAQRRSADVYDPGQQADVPKNRDELEANIRQRLLEQGRDDIVKKMDARTARRQDEKAVREAYKETRNDLMVERRELREQLKEMKGTAMEEEIRQKLEWNREDLNSQRKAIRRAVDITHAQKKKGDES